MKYMKLSEIVKHDENLQSINLVYDTLGFNGLYEFIMMLKRFIEIKKISTLNDKYCSFYLYYDIMEGSYCHNKIFTKMLSKYMKEHIITIKLIK